MKFKKLVENMSTYAIMLRRDGEVFDVTFHPYGTDGPDYTIEYAEWLYNHTNYDKTKQDILSFMKTYAVSEGIEIDDISDEIETPLTALFVKHIKEQGVRGNLPILWGYVENDLNQEFLRARFGGRYDSDDVIGGEIVFRVSSDEFNWFDVIYSYVTNNKNTIKYVTIVRDLESTYNDYIYKDGKNVFYRMPVEEFLTVKGNPIIEQKE